MPGKVSHQQMDKSPKNILRWTGRVIGGLILLTLVLALAAATYEAIASARDKRKYPPPGKLVAVGGYRLHIYCTGEGSPTVVLDAGNTRSSLDWILVLPEVAKLTHVCSYDRAGLGWSDPGPTPRTSQQIIEELYSLLANAGLKGPYVLVGHSFSGVHLRLYASNYANEVVGMVLVDPAIPDIWLGLTHEQKKNRAARVRRLRVQAILARLGMMRLYASLVSRGVLKRPEAEMARLKKLPPEIQPIQLAIASQPKFFDAVASQMEFLPDSAAQVALTGPYGGMPLVVLTSNDAKPSIRLLHEGVARLSSNGKHIVAAKGGHYIQLDEPELVIDAIRQVVEAARATKRMR